MERIELIKKAKMGDKEALLGLIMEQEKDFYKLAYVYMKNANDAMDVLQDMIVILYENIAKLKKDESFYSWAKTILVNECKRKLKKNNKLIFINDIKEQSTDDVFDSPEDRIVFERYISKLSKKHQEVIKLKFYMDYDYETICNILKIPLGTVKSRVNAGMKSLKESLGGEYIG